MASVAPPPPLGNALAYLTPEPDADAKAAAVWRRRQALAAINDALVEYRVACAECRKVGAW